MKKLPGDNIVQLFFGDNTLYLCFEFVFKLINYNDVLF